MAARSSTGNGDGAVDGADGPVDELDDVDDFDADAEEDLEPEDLDEEDLDEEDLDEEDLADDDVEGDEDLAVAEAADEGDDPEDGTDVLETVVVPPDAAFDDDDEADIAAAVRAGTDDGDEVDGIRDGEFVCRGCNLAMRDTQLADPKAMLCRDCA